MRAGRGGLSAGLPQMMCSAALPLFGVLYSGYKGFDVFRSPYIGKGRTSETIALDARAALGVFHPRCFITPVLYYIWSVSAPPLAALSPAYRLPS
ncbi:hypothetical protein BJX66DRAFT_199639 [Aspergillus keveii]|uniref:Uncharacterized protein n=1 Tax=Aspergillus keveii TaxID=714993 RepID=A0ABR4G617_9EURO